MNIRAIRESDSEQFLLLGKLLDEETQFMMLEPGERTMTIEEQTQRIKSVLSRDNQMIFVVEHENQLVGFLGAFGGNFRRNHHCAYIVIDIRQIFAGQGIGRQLFAVLEKWAIDHKLHRLELTVMSHNERAIRLYQKMGFKTEGIKQDSLLVNDKYVDEYYMAKIFRQSQSTEAQ
ncbi:MAG TPA: GNAT family N-acetyltransferase [Anaerolineales bacterium]|nr:GNAT family N-acetyltransferase [Anaerolineales bacterium]